MWSDDALFYVLSVRLTILIWTVLPASYRYTGQVLAPGSLTSYQYLRTFASCGTIPGT